MAVNNWFTTEQIDRDTYVISEYRHWEETHCYLLVGDKRCLLIDTGLGVGSMGAEVRHLTDKPVAAAVTHAHWDHIGGLSDFPEFYVHSAEWPWLREGGFPLPLQTVKTLLTERCDLPDGFDPSRYAFFHGVPSGALADHDTIDLGGRRVEALHTPGHSPGHLSFWERERGYLFTGDLAYRGTLYANYPSTDPAAYLASLERVAALPVSRVLPAHHALDIKPEILLRMRDALRALNAAGKLRHGGGTFDYGDWAIAL